MNCRDKFAYRIFLFSRCISDHCSIARQRICFRPLQIRCGVLCYVKQCIYEQFSEYMDMNWDEFCAYRIFLFSRYISDHCSIVHQRICFRPLQNIPDSIACTYTCSVDFCSGTTVFNHLSVHLTEQSINRVLTYRIIPNPCCISCRSSSARRRICLSRLNQMTINEI